MSYQLIIPERLQGRQWKSILRSELGTSERLLRQLTRDNAVIVNGHSVYLTARAETGDALSVDLPQEQGTVEPERIPLDIAYEDDEVMVVNKPPGMLTHPSARERYGSVLAAAAYHLRSHKQVPHCVHRLDRDTSGLVLLAKHAHFHHLYDNALRRGLIHRTYAAILDKPQNPCMLERGSWHTIDRPIANDPDAPSKRIIHDDGQRAVTHYQVIAQTENVAMAGVLLETGRTHQIRLHLASVGLPLVGEPHYADALTAHPSPRLRSASMRRQALHATALRWTHPILGDARAVFASPPIDMLRYWSECGGKAEDWERLKTLDYTGYHHTQIDDDGMAEVLHGPEL